MNMICNKMILGLIEILRMTALAFKQRFKRPRMTPIIKPSAHRNIRYLLTVEQTIDILCRDFTILRFSDDDMSWNLRSFTHPLKIIRISNNQTTTGGQSLVNEIADRKSIIVRVMHLHRQQSSDCGSLKETRRGVGNRRRKEPLPDDKNAECK